MIEPYSGLINKKNCLSQIQDKSRFFVTAFGDSKRIYDVERFLVSLILPAFKSFSPCELQSLCYEGSIDYSKKQNY